MFEAFRAAFSATTKFFTHSEVLVDAYGDICLSAKLATSRLVVEMESELHEAAKPKKLK
jgi:hypothetical protein